jgi:hypothetical protein
VIVHPDIKQTMINALGNVVPSHLLDRRLVPGRTLTPA